MGQYCIAVWRLSSSSVTLPAGQPAAGSMGMWRGHAAGGRAIRPPCTWMVGTPAAGRPTLHGGPVVLRPVRATPCFMCNGIFMLSFYCRNVYSQYWSVVCVLC